MEIPRRLWRFPTRQAEERLAARFGLPDPEGWQDWEYIFSDPARLDEFLTAYELDEMSDDERFSLMEMIIDSFSEDEIFAPSPRWLHALELIERNIELHFYTVCYWASLDSKKSELNTEFAWPCAAQMRALLNRHRQQFGFPHRTLPVP